VARLLAKTVAATSSAVSGGALCNGNVTRPTELTALVPALQVDTSSGRGWMSPSPMARGRYDCVAATDGIYSGLRALVFLDAVEPQYTGQCSWRIVADRRADMTKGTIYVGARNDAPSGDAPGAGIGPLDRTARERHPLPGMGASYSAGRLSFRQGKRKRKVDMPVYSELAAILNAVPRKADTICTRAKDMSWTVLPRPADFMHNGGRQP
jgi:hypothetical protein